MTALDVFLRINRVDLKVSQKNLIETAYLVAAFHGNFPLDALTRWIRAGCTGRPRRIVAVLADDWPEVRGIMMALVRDSDRRRGRGPRIPGTRVRTSAAHARLIAEYLEQQATTTEQQRRLPNGSGATRA